MIRRLILAGKYLFDSRIGEYHRILEKGLKRGYTFCSVEDSLSHLKSGCERLIVLRHDVDQRSPGVQAMAEVEERLGVHATYYFRWRTLDIGLAQRLFSAGHEVSYHFETIAEYAELLKICRIEQLSLFNYQSRCLSLLEDQLNRFRQLTQLPCRTLASHGAPLNQILGVSNATLLQSNSDRQRLGIILEAYNSDYLKQFDAYISDTQMEINDGFRYGLNPSDAMNQSISRIVFLSHPNHWAFSTRTKIRRVAKVVLFRQISDNAPFAYSKILRNRQR